MSLSNLKPLSKLLRADVLLGVLLREQKPHCIFQYKEINIMDWLSKCPVAEKAKRGN